MSHECCEGVRGLKFSRRYFLKQGGVAMVGLSAMPAFLQRAIQPPIFRGFYAGRARFHEILRVEMRPRGIGRTDSVHDRKLVLVEQRLQRSEAGMQAEKSVQVDRCVRSATPGLRNRNAWPQAVVIRLAERNHDIQAIRRAALKQYDQLLFVRHRRGGHRALQERGHRAQANHGHAALL